MKNHFTLALIGGAMLSSLIACAHAQPSEELIKARQAYANAANGPAVDLDPADLHEARVSLDVAEEQASKDSDSPHARQAAYMALRRAELADAQGKTAAASKARAEYAQQERDLKDQILARTQNQLAATSAANDRAQGALAETKSALSSANAAQVQTQAQLQAEHDARIAAEKTAMDALAKLGAVKNDERGLVLTLSGSVIFASGKSILLPSAQTRLNEVASALRESPRMIRVEGHTDSVGSDATNQALSQRRAEAVMNYLISQNIPQQRISAVGLASSRPVADNATAEGRANNRRVEIILLRDAQASADVR